MISWVVIGIIVLIGIFVVRSNHHRHKYVLIFFLVFSIFLYFSMTYVAKKNNQDLNSFDGFIKTSNLYFGWLANGFNNLRVITGNAVKMDWSNSNSTFFKPK